MRYVGSILMMFIILLLLGCSKPDITSETDRTDVFLTDDRVSYDVTEYVMSNGMGARVLKGYYMPEINHTCFEIVIDEYDSDGYYSVSYNYEEELYNYSSQYAGLSVDEENKAMICNKDIEFDWYDIEIVRTNRSGVTQFTLATIHYEDEYFSTRKTLQGSITPDDQATVPLYGNPYISLTLQIDGISDFPEANFVVKEYKEELKEDVILNLDDFDLSDDNGIYENYTLDGLSPGFTYSIELLYRPISNDDTMFRLDFNRVDASLMEGLTYGCAYEFICARILGYEVFNDYITYDLYVLLDQIHINEDTNKPQELFFKVYNNNSELLYSSQITNDQRSIDIPIEFIPEIGKIKLESDIIINEKHSTYQYNLVVDDKRIYDGELD